MRNSDIVLENAEIVLTYDTLVEMLMEYGVSRSEIAKRLKGDQPISGRIKQTGNIIEYDFAKRIEIKRSK